MVLTAKEFNVVVFLVEMEVEVAAALGAFQSLGKHTRLLSNSRLFAPCAFLQSLHLFPSHTVNDGLMDIEEDCPVFFRVFNAPLHLVGFGVAFEVNNIAAVFLQGQYLLDGGMSPFGRLQGAFGAAAVDTLAPPVVGRIDDPILTQSVCDFSQAIPLQGHIINTPHHIGGLRVDHPKPGIIRVFDVPIGRLGQWDACVAFHLVYDFTLLRDVLGIPLVHNVPKRGKLIVPLVTIHAIGNGDQAHIVLREKLFGQLADLYVVAAKTGKVFDKYGGDISGLDCGQHFLKTGPLHGGAGNAIVYEK